MPLICTVLALDSTNTNEAYLNFYMMLSSDIIHLMSPKFKDDDELDFLFKKLVETICLHEGMFPISEATICWHQLMDLPLHIKKFGPIRCWWEFSGERSLSTLKKDVPYGGPSYDKCVMRSYNEKEIVNIQDNFCFNIKEGLNETNTMNDINNFSIRHKKYLQYSDEKFLMKNLIDREGKVKYDKFNEYETEMIIDQLVLEIKKVCRNKYEAYYKSSIYRMYDSYLFQKENDFDGCFQGVSFYNFLKYFCMDETNDFYKKYAIHKSASEVFYEYYEHTDFEAIETKGNFIIEDLVTIHKILNEFSPTRFKDAIVFGVAMDSRGIEYCEKEAPWPDKNGKFGPTNPQNELKNCWFNKNSISSWFKYRYQSSEKDEFGFEGYTKCGFGQFNYFFRINLPQEQLLHGLPMASSVCRDQTLDKYMNTINISLPNESFSSRPFNRRKGCK
jgi:hypothetical protein